MRYMTINRNVIVGTEFAFEALGFGFWGFAASAISKCYIPFALTATIKPGGLCILQWLASDSICTMWDSLKQLAGIKLWV